LSFDPALKPLYNSPSITASGGELGYNQRYTEALFKEAFWEAEAQVLKEDSN